MDLSAFRYSSKERRLAHTKSPQQHANCNSVGTQCTLVTAVTTITVPSPGATNAPTTKAQPPNTSPATTAEQQNPKSVSGGTPIGKILSTEAATKIATGGAAAVVGGVASLGVRLWAHVFGPLHLPRSKGPIPQARVVKIHRKTRQNSQPAWIYLSPLQRSLPNL